jgi:hypothetical protein
MKTVIGAAAAQAQFGPQCVNLTSDLCCIQHEWLVFPLRSKSKFYADTAFSTLRAQAARKPNSHKGFKPAIKDNSIGLAHPTSALPSEGTELKFRFP